MASLSAFVGALCCLAPIVLVLFGLAAVSIANDLGNVLYGEYKWEFRLAALAFLALGLLVYFRRRGVCSIDEARRQRTRIVNVTLLSLFTATSLYIFWNYVVLHYWGIAAGLPWAQWDESWAIPTSAVLLTLTAVGLLVYQRSKS
jgi:amino acid transporter